MEVNSVSRQPVQPAQSAASVRKADDARATERRADESRQAKAAAEDVKRQEPPKREPVINTQGQTTGRLVNTTA